MEVNGGREVKVVAAEDKSRCPHHHPRHQGRGPRGMVLQFSLIKLRSMDSDPRC